ncbi:hypothetical protein Pcinc_029082 [Petrolisthes cinctipes]|uniref:Uncharacterized protein n=1 Tax=Petrolisthes cinctipes TaxID=88211 RepID=A0AAE1K689_PETCI|nr:hypothetical protein Pcinc_029082 [Petrolisthes cinctipes]
MSEALSRKLQSFLSSALTSFAQRRNFDVSGGWAGQRACSSPSPPDGWCHCDHCPPQATLWPVHHHLRLLSLCAIFQYLAFYIPESFCLDQPPLNGAGREEVRKRGTL